MSGTIYEDCVWPLADLVAELRALHQIWANEAADRLEAGDTPRLAKARQIILDDTHPFRDALLALLDTAVDLDPDDWCDPHGIPRPLRAVRP